MHERIEINPEIMGGKPVIRGTRVPVEIVLRKLGAGMTPEAKQAAKEAGLDNNQKALTEVAKAPPAKQVDVAKRIAACRHSDLLHTID